MHTDELPWLIRKLLACRHRARVHYLLSKVFLKTKMRIIDVGCGVDGRSFDDYVSPEWEITGVDILAPERVRHQHPHFTYVQRDARDLSCFADREFDLATCIGMLEHITDEGTFRPLVSEIRRVAKEYVVVVPYKYCWIEPHYGVPFFPLFPDALQRALVTMLNLSNHGSRVRKDPEYIRKHFRWLSNREYRRAFPDAILHLLPTLETIAITRKCPL